IKTGLYQGTHLKQEMKINPRLYQAMDLLYMPLLDLQQHIKQEMLNNPFLELEEPQVTEEEIKPPETEKEDNEPLKPFTIEEMEDMLRILQGFDPPGIASRDLRECLLLQLQDAELEDTLAYRIVR